MTVFGYCRLSIREADEGTSLDSQRNSIQSYADQRNETVEWFTDDGFSGRSGNRPAYQAMFQRLSEPGVTAVVARSVDRLGRNLKEFLLFTEAAQELGVPVVAVASGIDTSTSAGVLFAQLLGVFAQAESGAIAERQVYSQAERRKQGRSIGVLPYGYASVESGSGAYRVIVENEANLILDAVNAVMEGSSISAAAVTMNQAGATSKRGNPWNGSTLRRLLMNPTLAGLRHYEGTIQLDDKGKVYHDSDTEIIPLATWRELQKVIGSRGVKRKVGTSGEQLMLAGIALCGSCNALMSRDTYKTKDGRASQYRCSSKTRFTCPLPVTVVAARLDAFVIEQLQPLGHLLVTKLVSEEEPATVIQRETLSLQIESIAGEFATASPEQVSELASTLSGLKQQLIALPSKLVERYEETGETFAEVLAHSPALIAQQAIEAVIVAPPAVKYQQRLDGDRVQIMWKEPEQFDTD